MTEHPHGQVDLALRAAVHDAVSDVHPEHGLDEIQARTSHGHRRTWVWAAVAAVAATAATVAVVTVVTDRGPGQVADQPPAASSAPEVTAPDQATAAPSPTGTPTAAPTTNGLLPVYFVGDTPAGPRLYREFLQPMGGSGLQSERLLQALELSIGGDADDPDFRSGWPGGGTPDGFNVVGAGGLTGQTEENLISIAVDSQADLAARPSGLSADGARLALQQLVYTAQAVMQQRLPVQFTGPSGVPLQTLLGVDVTRPVTEDDPMLVQAPVWIIDPQEGATVGHTFTVDGRGSFFEANVSWQLLQRGRVVKQGHAMATECCTLAPFSFEVRDVIEGTYTLRVYDADMSGGEGTAGEQQDTKEIIVTK